jgi:hypothetical protein
MQSYLFIGGDQDGVNVPMADDVESIQLSKETYIRDTLAVGLDASFTFYRHDELTPEGVLDLLVKYYEAWAVGRR